MTEGATASDEVRADSWGNLITGLGGTTDARSYNYLRGGIRLGQQQIDDLYGDNSLAARIVDAIPDHGTRRWIDLETDPKGEAGKVILDRMEELEARERFRDWWALDRKDGGAVLVIGADDGQNPALPLDLGSVRAVKHLHVLERWEVTRGMTLEADSSKRWFGAPTSYTLNSDTMGQSVGQEIHASRVLVLQGIRVSRQRQQANGGWGDSVLQRALGPLGGYDTTWSYLEASIKRFSETWIKMRGLRELMSSGKGDVIKTRLALLSAMRSALKIAPIDADDDVKEMALQLAGMEGMISKAEARLCAGAEMPGTVLFGYAPGGLSTDDASGTRNWGDTISQRQRRTLLSPLNYLIEILLAAKEKPLPKASRWQVVFRPLIEPTDKEVAEVEYLRAQSSAIYVQTQQLDLAEARDTLRADPHSRFKLAEVEEPEDPDVPEVDPKADPDAPPPVPGAKPAPPGAPAPAAGAEKVQDTALNGSQTDSLRDILKDVAKREMDRDSGIEAMMLSFNIDRPRAVQLMGKTGLTFFVDPPAPANDPPTPPKPGQE